VGTAQVAECLPNTHKALASIPSTTINNESWCV
jgi:hypothetical protein